ncbi:MAG: cobalamin B12-binding domain-containing protein [bacterium]
MSGRNDGQERKIRVLIAKPGLDGHDRGAKVVAHALRDAGMEVIYTGIRQSPEQIAQAALQEDVGAVGLSSLSGAHATLFPRVIECLRKKGLTEVVVFGGGIIPPEDAEELRSKGMQALFGPGTTTEEIVDFIRKTVKPRTP